MNRIWQRWLVGLAWGIPLLYIALMLTVFGGDFGECGGSMIGLWLSSVVLEAAAIAGLLAIRISWLGLAAAVATATNIFLYWIGVEDFLTLMG